MGGTTCTKFNQRFKPTSFESLEPAPTPSIHWKKLKVQCKWTKWTKFTWNAFFIYQNSVHFLCSAQPDHETHIQNSGFKAFIVKLKLIRYHPKLVFSFIGDLSSPCLHDFDFWSLPLHFLSLLASLLIFRGSLWNIIHTSN